MGPPQPAGGAWHHPDSGRRTPLEKNAGLRRAWLPGGGRLHGSRELGHRHRRRREVRLHASERHRPVELHGDPAAVARGSPRDRQRARPRASLPRLVFQAHRVRAVDRVRDRDRRVRPGRSPGCGHRAAAAVRHPASMGRVPDGDRRVSGAVPAEPRVSLRRSHRADADSRHRRLLRDRALDGTARSDRVGRRGDSASSRFCGTRRCFTSPSAYSAPP